MLLYLLSAHLKLIKMLIISIFLCKVTLLQEVQDMPMIFWWFYLYHIRLSNPYGSLFSTRMWFSSAEKGVKSREIISIDRKCEFRYAKHNDICLNAANVNCAKASQYTLVMHTNCIFFVRRNILSVRRIHKGNKTRKYSVRNYFIWMSKNVKLLCSGAI